MRLGINALRGSPPNGPMPNGQFYPVIINRAANDTFHALSSRCTHEGCIVDALDSSTAQINCPCHGSVYAIDGKRVSGPASSALTRYTVTFDGQNELEVRIPNLGYSIVGSTVQPAGNGSPRFRLDFAPVATSSTKFNFGSRWTRIRPRFLLDDGGRCG